MGEYRGYYKSDIGDIEIKCNEESVISIKFIDIRENEIRENRVVKQAVKELDEYFRGKRENFDLSLSLNGTEFQKIVWNELINIPYGSKISYEKIAEMIGNKKSVRAAATAVAANPILIIIPCHRVIRKNGDIGNYSGGSEIKKQLLEMEVKKA